MNSAAQRERNGEDDMRGFLRRAIDDEEQEKDDEQARSGTMTRKRPLRAELVFVLPAVFDGHAWQPRNDLASMRVFHFLTNPPRSRSLTFACTNTRRRPFSLAISFGPSARLIVRDLSERNHLPPGVATRTSPSRVMSSRSLRSRRTWIGNRCAALDRRA